MAEESANKPELLWMGRKTESTTRNKHRKKLCKQRIKHKNSLTNVYNVDIMQEISYIIAMTKTDEQAASREPGRVETRWRTCSGSHPFRAEDSKGMRKQSSRVFRRCRVKAEGLSEPDEWHLIWCNLSGTAG